MYIIIRCLASSNMLSVYAKLYLKDCRTYPAGLTFTGTIVAHAYS